MASASGDPGMMPTHSSPEMMEMSEEIQNLRGTIMDIDERLKKTTEFVDVQAGVLKEGFLADMQQRDELIASIRQEMDRKQEALDRQATETTRQALTTESIATRVQALESNNYPEAAAAAATVAAAAAMEAVSRRVEVLERGDAELETRLQGIEEQLDPEFYTSLQRTLEGSTREFLDQLEPNLIQRTVSLEERRNEVDEVLNNLKLDLEEKMEATTTTTTTLFAENCELFAKFKESTEQKLKEVYELELRIQNLETFKGSTEYRLESIVGELKVDIPHLHKSLAEVNTRVDEAGRRGRDESSGDDGKFKPRNLTQSKGLEKLRYGGQPERYSSWKYKMEVFLESEVSSFGGFLKYLESEADFKGGDVTATDLERFAAANPSYNVPYMNSQLYLVLAASLEEGSAPLARVQNLHEKAEVRGALAWQTVVRDAVGMSGTRLQALATRVHTPDRVHKYSDVASAIEQWAALVREYESACGSGGTPHCVPDSAKITALRQLVPKELDADIGRQSGLKSLKEVRDYVDEQIIIRRKPYFEPAPGGKNTDKGGDLNHVPWDQNSTDWGEGEWSPEQWPEASTDQELLWMGKGKGKGGKGKGKGKGGFKGNCYYCNKPGHRLNECRQKDEDMAAKGKGGKGKGMYNGKGKGSFGKGGSKGAWETPPGLGSLMPQSWMGSLSWMDGEYYEDPNYASSWPTPGSAHQGPLRQLCALQSEEPRKTCPAMSEENNDDEESEEELSHFVELLKRVEESGIYVDDGIEDLKKIRMAGSDDAVDSGDQRVHASGQVQALNWDGARADPGPKLGFCTCVLAGLKQPNDEHAAIISDLAKITEKVKSLTNMKIVTRSSRSLSGR